MSWTNAHLLCYFYEGYTPEWEMFLGFLSHTETLLNLIGAFIAPLAPQAGLSSFAILNNELWTHRLPS